MSKFDQQIVFLKTLGAILGMLLSLEVSAARHDFKLYKGQNHYELLEVSQTADKTEIVKAFRAQAKVLHPDAGGDEEDFKAASQAHEDLKDPSTRAAYDSWLRTQSSARRSKPGGAESASGFDQDTHWRAEQARRAYEEQRRWQESQGQQGRHYDSRREEQIQNVAADVNGTIRQELHLRQYYLEDLLHFVYDSIDHHLGYLYRSDRELYFRSLERLFSMYALN
ncbi:MAG: DnaJ domain-containing protein, partial [Pseudomonadota bacterium]